MIKLERDSVVTVIPGYPVYDVLLKLRATRLSISCSNGVRAAVASLYCAVIHFQAGYHSISECLVLSEGDALHYRITCVVFSNSGFFYAEKSKD